jgi:hypothetical protein
MGAITGGARNIVTDGLVFYIDAANPLSYPGTGNTIYNLIRDTSYPSMALFGDTANYGSIGNGVVTLGGASNNTSAGTILQGVGALGDTINSDFTTMGWQYRTASKSGEILSYRETSFRLSFDITDDAMVFYQRELVSPYTINSTNVSVVNNLNIWNHFALVRSGNSWSFYKNGVLLGTNTFTPTETLSGTAFHIGGAWSDDDYLSNCMNGSVGPTLHYTRALSSAEILQNFNSTRARFGV